MGCGTSNQVSINDKNFAGKSQAKSGVDRLPLDEVTSVAALGAQVTSEDYISLPFELALSQWTDKDVRVWLRTLPSALNQYIDNLTGPGGLLLYWDDMMLQDAGVNNKFHRLQLLEYCRQLTQDVARRQKEHPDLLIQAFRPENGENKECLNTEAEDMKEADSWVVESVGFTGKEDTLNYTHHGQLGKGETIYDQNLRSKVSNLLMGGYDEVHDPLFGDSKTTVLRKHDDKATAKRPTSALPFGSALELASFRSPTATTAVAVTTHASQLKRQSSTREASGKKDAQEDKESGAGNTKGKRDTEGGCGKGCVDEASEEKQGTQVPGMAEMVVGVLQSVASLGAKVLPWPGDAAASALSELLKMTGKAIINKRNWVTLNQRSADLLRLVIENKELQSDTPIYRNIMTRLLNTLKAIEQFFIDYTNKNWLMRVVSNGGDAAMFDQFWRDLNAMISDATLSIGVQANEKLTTLAHHIATVPQPKYQDDSRDILMLMEELGGVDVVLRDQSRLAQVASKLGAGEQLVLTKVNQAAELLEASRDEGVHSLIQHPVMKVFWRKCFSPQNDVPWALWWEVFPEELQRVHMVSEEDVTTLMHRLAEPRRRELFQLRLHLYSSDRISVGELRRGMVPADADLTQLVLHLTESSDFSSSSATALKGTSSVAVQGVAIAAAAATAAAPVVGAPRDTLPPLGYNVPPLDPRFAARDEDVQAAAKLLLGSSDSNASQQGSVLTRNGANQAAGPAPPGSVLCIVAEPGQPKSALALGIARQLWDQGVAPGGCFLVDLQGSRTKIEVLDRFRLALGMPPLESAGSASLVASLAASEEGKLRERLVLLAERAGVGAGRAGGIRRGCLLVVDNVDSLLPVGAADSDSAQPNFSGNSPQAGCKATAWEQRPSRKDKPADHAAGGEKAGFGKLEDANEAGGGPEGTMSKLVEAVESLLGMAAEILVPRGGRMLITSNSVLKPRVVEPSASAWLGAVVQYYHLGLMGGEEARKLLKNLVRGLDKDDAQLLIEACVQNPDVLRSALTAASRKKQQTDLDLLTHGSSSSALNSPSSSTPSTPSSSLPSLPVPVWGAGKAAAAAAAGVSSSPPSTSTATATAAATVTATAQSHKGAAPIRPSRLQQPPSVRPSCDGGSDSVASSRSTAVTMQTPVLDPSDTPTTSNSASTSRYASLARALSVRGEIGAAAAAEIKASLMDTLGGKLRQQAGISKQSGESTPHGKVLTKDLSVSVTALEMSGVAGSLAGLPEMQYKAVLSLSAFAGSFTEAGAAALLGVPVYAARSTLEILEGHNLLMKNKREGGYSLQAEVQEAALDLLQEATDSEQVAVACRFIQYVLSLLRQADKLYNSAVQASMQLAEEIRGDLTVMMHLIATCVDREKTLAVLGIDGLMLLARTPILTALTLDCVPEYEALWRMLCGAAAPLPPPRPPVLSSPPIPSISPSGGPKSAGSSSFGAAANPLGSGRVIATPALGVKRAAAAAGSSSGSREAVTERGKAGGGGKGLVTVVEDPGIQAIALRCLGHGLMKGSRFSESEAAIKASLDLSEDIYGNESLELAACLNELGQLLALTGRYQDAEAVLRRALLIRQRRLGPHHLDVASSKNNLARVFRSEARYPEAEALYREALSIRIALLPDCHPDLAESYNSIGISLGQQKQYASEEQLYLQALDIRKRCLGVDHPDVAQAMNNVGTALANQGRHAEAETMFREALSIKMRVFGSDHPSVGVSLNNVGRALVKQGKLPEAEAMYRRALSVIQASLGPDHPATATCMANIVSMLRKQPGREAEVTQAREEYKSRFGNKAQGAGLVSDHVRGSRGESGLKAVALGYDAGLLEPSEASRITLAPLQEEEEEEQEETVGMWGLEDGYSMDEDVPPPFDGNLVFEESVSGSFGRSLALALAARAAASSTSSLSSLNYGQIYGSSDLTPVPEDDRWKPSASRFSTTQRASASGTASKYGLSSSTVLHGASSATVAQNRGVSSQSRRPQTQGNPTNTSRKPMAPVVAARPGSALTSRLADLKAGKPSLQSAGIINTGSPTHGATRYTGPEDETWLESVAPPSLDSAMDAWQGLTVGMSTSRQRGIMGTANKAVEGRAETGLKQDGQQGGPALSNNNKLPGMSDSPALSNNNKLPGRSDSPALSNNNKLPGRSDSPASSDAVDLSLAELAKAGSRGGSPTVSPLRRRPPAAAPVASASRLGPAPVASASRLGPAPVATASRLGPALTQKKMPAQHTAYDVALGTTVTNAAARHTQQQPISAVDDMQSSYSAMAEILALDASKPSGVPLVGSRPVIQEMAVLPNIVMNKKRPSAAAETRGSSQAVADVYGLNPFKPRKQLEL